VPAAPPELPLQLVWFKRDLRVRDRESAARLARQRAPRTPA
jgi:deoxyribodipyrimidine photolyase